MQLAPRVRRWHSNAFAFPPALFLSVHARVAWRSWRGTEAGAWNEQNTVAKMGVPQARWVAVMPQARQVATLPQASAALCRSARNLAFFTSLPASRAFLTLQGADLLAVQTIGMSSAPARFSSKVSTGYSLAPTWQTFFKFSPTRQSISRSRF